MDTNLMLKYKRERDCWLCPNCETENEMTFPGCTLCGYKKNPSVPILKAWSPEQEMMERKFQGGPGPGGDKGFSSGPDIRIPPGGPGADGKGSSSDKATIVLILVAIFVIIALFIGIAQ